MTAAAPFAAHLYPLASCELRTLQDPHEASVLSDLLARMDPWRTLRYTASALRRYLLCPDATLYRYAVVSQDTTIGVVCIRYPWLRGAYLELIGLDAAYQGRGVGCEILCWLEEQAQREACNVWILVSAFNTRARTFYTRQGFTEIGPLKDFVRPGYDEILLRKVLPSKGKP
jgi:ribosomal protein S18 acetylase RimI-like enzyme